MPKSEVTALRIPSHIYEFINAQTSQTSATRNTVILDLITSSPAYVAHLSGTAAPVLPISNDEKLDIILSRLEESETGLSHTAELCQGLEMLERVLAANKDGTKGYQINSFAQGFKAVLEATFYLKGVLDVIAVQPPPAGQGEEDPALRRTHRT
jgi:hypothetical protein